MSPKRIAAPDTFIQSCNFFEGYLLLSLMGFFQYFPFVSALHLSIFSPLLSPSPHLHSTPHLKLFLLRNRARFLLTASPRSPRSSSAALHLSLSFPTSGVSNLRGARAKVKCRRHSTPRKLSARCLSTVRLPEKRSRKLLLDLYVIFTVIPMCMVNFPFPFRVKM